MKKNISLIDNIVKLKAEKDAIILAHNYQIDEIQDIADFIGDSLQLSMKASKVKNKIIVFCGVRFMAETAKIISPERKVLLPDKYSGCPMADMITDKQLANLKKDHPGAVVVCYVNTSARVKALSDICCTSSNAVKVVNSIPEDKQIIFIPDKYLGSYIQSQTGRKMILWNGFCPTHARIDVKTIIDLKKEHLGAVVLVHPECTPDVIEIADKVTSTGGMLSFVKQSIKKEFIIGTEIGLIYRLKKENTDKVFYPASSHAICPNMKLINLEKLMWSLEEEQFEIRLPQDVIDKARTAIDNMLALS
jgi:quinolinate synthase